MKADSKALDVSKFLRIVFRVSAGFFLAGVVLTGIFIRLNRHVETADGRVAGAFMKEVVKGRKQAVEKEYLRISYSVNGKEYYGAVLGEGHDQKGRVPVYYFPGLPSFAWFYKNSNYSMVYCAVFLLVSGLVMFFSWRDLRNSGPQEAPVEKTRKKG
jgi:hypothetical protein